MFVHSAHFFNFLNSFLFSNPKICRCSNLESMKSNNFSHFLAEAKDLSENVTKISILNQISGRDCALKGKDYRRYTTINYKVVIPL